MCGQRRMQEFALSSPLPSLTLRSRVPINQIGDLGERCKLVQRGPGRRKRIWCTLEL